MNNNTGYFVKTAPNAADWELARPALQKPVCFVELHPDSGPEAIWEEHDYLIRQARRVNSDPEAIAQAIDLPLSIVQKHLIEMGVLDADNIFRWWRPDRSPRPRAARQRKRSRQAARPHGRPCPGMGDATLFATGR